MIDSATKTPAKTKHGETEPQSPLLGPYYLVDRISRGGMSDIFLAKREGYGGFVKPLVIKRLLPQFATMPRYVKRFVNEAKTLASLNHPNIVQALDMGSLDDQYYIALEYISGRNLAHVISKAKKAKQMLPLAFALHVVIEVAKGLMYAHRKKGSSGEHLMLVHQDVNSFNIMVSYDAYVKIIDFGIARMFLEEDDGNDLPVAGKLLYFSPEQLQGKPLDRRVDIYGIGVLMYELLTTDRLFEHGQTVGETMKTILETDLRAKIGDDERIPPELKPILIKATAARPEDRYAWMEELIEEILEVISAGSLELDHAQFSKYMKSQFQKEMLIDQKRMRRLLSSQSAYATPTLTIEMDTQEIAPLTSEPTEEPSKELGLLETLNMQTSAEPTDKDLPDAADRHKKSPRKIKVKAGRTIFRQGESGSFVYVIKDGKVSIYLEIGQMEQTVTVLGKGDFFGETALLGDEYRGLAAKAIDDCLLFAVDKDSFASILGRGSANEVIRRLIERLKTTVSALAGAMVQDPLSRFIHSLAQLYARSSHENGVPINLAELKEMSKLNDEDQIKKYLSKLEALKILEARENRIIIKDLAKLDNILKMLSGGAKFSLKL